MAKPVDDRSAPVADAYGDYNRLSADGKYWFEWTPFTPAIRAWQTAERYLRSARDHLVDAKAITGFAIPGLEADFREFEAKLKVLTGDVHRATSEAGSVVRVLGTANTDYANAHDASYDEYRRLKGVIDNTLAAQGRPRS
jgi:hypothetical protein